MLGLQHLLSQTMLVFMGISPNAHLAWLWEAVRHHPVFCRATHPLSGGCKHPSSPPGRVWVWMEFNPHWERLWERLHGATCRKTELRYLPSSASRLMKLALCEMWL